MLLSITCLVYDVEKFFDIKLDYSKKGKVKGPFVGANIVTTLDVKTFQKKV